MSELRFKTSLCADFPTPRRVAHNPYTFGWRRIRLLPCKVKPYPFIPPNRFDVAKDSVTSMKMKKTESVYSRHYFKGVLNENQHKTCQY